MGDPFLAVFENGGGDKAKQPCRVTEYKQKRLMYIASIVLQILRYACMQARA
jgi:hypothetical protein